MNSVLCRALVGMLLASVMLPASAVTLNYDLGTGNGISTGSGQGNSYEFVDQSVTLTVSAWADLKNDFLQASTVTQFDDGLGACNSREGQLRRCLNRSRRNQIDNGGRGQQDWILLYLPETVSFDQVVIDSQGFKDQDLTFWVGDVTTPVDLDGVEYEDLMALGFGAATTLFNPAAAGASLIDLGGQVGNVLLIGARLGDKNDAFLLSSLSVTVVPLPPALWLFGSALGLLYAKRRRTGHRAG